MMNEMKRKAGQAAYEPREGRIYGVLQTAAEQFRIGEDAAGIKNLLTAAAKLETVIEADQRSQRPRIDLERLLPALKTLLFYMQNQDIAGITDLLEDVLLPLSEGWAKGDDGV
ncbi:MAG: hypothetical protein VB086_02345 [Clostridiaceae bacterium]|nr:hypothetical protein [Clostridiaceae bacterium]